MAETQIFTLARPLTVVPAAEREDGLTGALLVSAGDHDQVAAAVFARAATFDADAAFRALDGVRSRAEMVLQWVEESLAGTRSAPPAPVKPGPPAWAGAAAGAFVVAPAALLASASDVLPAGAWSYLAVTVLATIYLLDRWWKNPANVIGLLAAAAVPVCAVRFFWGVVIGMPEPRLAGAARIFLVAVGALVAHTIFHWYRAWAVAEEVRASPREYASAVREGAPSERVARYQPELCTLNGEPDLYASIHCLAEDGYVLRWVVLPLDGATREGADEMARMALAADEKVRLLREAEEEQDRASAEARERLLELERVRAQLPDP